MTGTLLLLGIIPVFAVYGLISSRNHLARINLGYIVGVVISGLFIIISEAFLKSRLIQPLMNWYNGIDNWITDNIIVSFDVLWTLIIFGIFIVFSLMSRVFSHYFLLGKNPARVDNKSLTIHIFNIVIYFIFSFAVFSFLIANLNPAMGFDDGFFKPLFNWIRGSIK